MHVRIEERRKSWHHYETIVWNLYFKYFNPLQTQIDEDVHILTDKTALSVFDFDLFQISFKRWLGNRDQKHKISQTQIPWILP